MKVNSIEKQEDDGFDDVIGHISLMVLCWRGWHTLYNIKQHTNNILEAQDCCNCRLISREHGVSRQYFFFFCEKWPVKHTDVSKATHIGRTLRDSAEAAIFFFECLSGDQPFPPGAAYYV